MTGELPGPQEQRIQISQAKVLAGEGIEEVRFFTALLKHLGLGQPEALSRESWIVGDIQLLQVGGKDRFRARLKALVSVSGFASVRSLGIVRDADIDPHATFLSVCDALKAANLTVPQYPALPMGQSPQVAVMILPDPSTPGMLEDLCLRAVSEDPAMHCVENYFDCLQAQGLQVPNAMAIKSQPWTAPRGSCRSGILALGA
jgi:hypothetical protein